MIPRWLTPDLIELLLGGLWLTLWLTAVTTITSFLLGVSIGGLRLSQRRTLQIGAGLFVETFRNIPALVLIIFLAFAVPNLFPLPQRQLIFFNNPVSDLASSLTGLTLPYYALAAGVALTLNTSAYIAELFRAGAQSLPQQTIDSARSLGASYWTIFRRLMLPTGVRVAFPAISTRFVHNMKNTALASFVAVPEYFRVTQTAVSRSFQAIQLLLLAAVVYLLLSFAFSTLLQVVDRRLT